jgi:Flp pilus assembly protein TadG
MLQRGRYFGHGLKSRPFGNLRKLRGQRGNMIILVLAILMGILMLLLAFSLSYVRMLGSNSEQKTAIEAAALAAARDLGRIVIEDPNFGFVSISDAAPSTPNTKADDGFSLPVTSINTLLGTIRLDMIIASQLGDTTMATLADTDYTNAMSAKDFLVASLQQAMLPGSGGANLRDVDGNVVSPYQAAVEAYQQNVVRIAGGNSRLVNGSMKLTLGCLSKPSMTATAVPTPSALASVGGTQVMQGYYSSYTDIPFGGKSFVFAGIGKDVKLVDQNVFAVSPGSVPYSIPTIVKAEADHLVVSAGAGGANIVHAVACAQPASVHDPRPAPGALTLSFLSGKIPEMAQPGSLLTDPQLAGDTLKVKTSVGGDTPGGGTLTPTTLPPYGGSMPASEGLSTGFYDWIRRAGTKADVSAVKNFMSTPYKPGITDTVGGINVYTWNSDGTIRYVQLTGITSRNVVVSNLQGFVEGAGVFSSTNGNSYELSATDECRQPGRMRGGQHGGEPLTDAIVSAAAALPGDTIAGVRDDFGTDIAGLASLLLMIFFSCGLFAVGTQRKSKPLQRFAASVLLAGACASSLGFLTACGGGGAPPPVVVTSSVTGARVPRATYISNGIVVDVTFKKK